MKKLILLGLICFMSEIIFAQANTDSLTYQLERQKINSMLAQRALKFGQYDESLSMRTGIFGFQTKRDIRRSNEILMDIVKTDDSIYKEIKILLEYRAFQQSQAQSHSNETEEYNIGFMNTINKLRNQLDQLKAGAQKQEQQREKTLLLYIAIFILMLASILYLLIRNRKPKT